MILSARIVHCVGKIIVLMCWWTSYADARDVCGAGVPCIFKGKVDGWEKYVESTGPKPYPIKTESWKRSDTTIFYSISSYRDELCPRTLYNAFTKATYPDRLHIAVVQQNTKGDIDCLEKYCEMMMTARNISRGECPHEHQINMNRQRAEDAKGPTWARAIGSAMVGDEEFCMQTDSHMDFVRNWDRNLLDAWALTENEYAVLSTYVTAIEELPKVEDGQRGINNQHEVPHLCMITYGANQMVRNWGTKCLRNFEKPKLTNIVWGAGLSFSKCHAERKTMYDPFTPGIFDGEEFTKAIKLWTYGYDIYTPHRVYVVHDYHKSQGNPIHSSWARAPIPNDERLRGILRMKTICGLPEGMTDPSEALTLRRSKYGLGDRRTMEQAIQFSGFALNNRTTLANRCGNLDFVPFIEHPLGPDYIPKFDPITFAPLDEPDVGSIYYDESNARKHPAVLSPQMATAIPMSAKRVEPEPNGAHAQKSDERFSRSQPLLSISKSIASDNLRREGLESRRQSDHILHALAFMGIFLGPVTVVMCFFGKCSFASGSVASLFRDEKALGKFT